MLKSTLIALSILFPLLEAGAAEPRRQDAAPALEKKLAPGTTPLVNTPSVLRHEGTVVSHDRQEYVLELDAAPSPPTAFGRGAYAGGKETLHYDSRMRVFLRGHAVRWVTIKPGDRITVIQTESPEQSHPGARDAVESSGLIQSLDRKAQTFVIRNSQGQPEEFLNDPGVLVYRHGRSVRYDELNPGNAVAVKFGE